MPQDPLPVRVLGTLERHLGRLAVPNLTLYLVVSMAAAWILSLLQPGLLELFTLRGDRLMAGEYWRAITFLAMPPETSWIFIVFVLMFYYISGSTLEGIWGTFVYNLFVWTGMAGTIAASLLFPDQPVTNMFLLLSIFLAFAAECPTYTVLMMFFFPMEIRFLGYLTWGMLAWNMLVALFTGQYHQIVFCFVALANYGLFFGPLHARRTRRLLAVSTKVAVQAVHKAPTLHLCTACGATERSHPQLEFRCCSGCDGDLEYCEVHLKDHVHRSVSTGDGGSSSDGMRTT